MHVCVFTINLFVLWCIFIHLPPATTLPISQLLTSIPSLLVWANEECQPLGPTSCRSKCVTGIAVCCCWLAEWEMTSGPRVKWDGGERVRWRWCGPAGGKKRRLPTVRMRVKRERSQKRSDRWTVGALPRIELPGGVAITYPRRDV